MDIMAASAIIILQPSEDPAELCHPPLCGSFKHSMGTEGLDKAVVVTNTIATTSTATSSHTTLSAVTSIGPYYTKV